LVGSKGPCYVQNTYKQEFMVNIISNPYFSSTSVLRHALLSKLETTFYNGPKYVQRAADIGIFPNMVRDTYNNSAFWPVVTEPAPIVAAGEYIPAVGLEDGVYYFDPATNEASRALRQCQRATKKTKTISDRVSRACITAAQSSIK
jgi:hypothetical protein